MKYQIDYDANPKRTDTVILSNGISDYAKQMRKQKPIEEFAFYIRDENQTIVGGANGAMYYGCLYIDQLWVSEKLRGQNYGTQLMKSAEKLGREKGCISSTVNTMDWEALDFYKKLGYHVEFERRGFVNNSILYFLRKEF